MKVRITNFSVTEDGLYRVTVFTDDGAHTIELDRFAHERSGTLSKGDHHADSFL